MSSILIFLFTCFAMEAWAWFMHKYILHGPLWFLHKSHHGANAAWFEWNDLVSVAYGVVASFCIINGIQDENELLAIGLGVTVYGIVYFIFS